MVDEKVEEFWVSGVWGCKEGMRSFGAIFCSFIDEQTGEIGEGLGFYLGFWEDEEFSSVGWITFWFFLFDWLAKLMIGFSAIMFSTTVEAYKGTRFIGNGC